jgi:multiple sugar transport system substrate-binding protein
MSSRHRQELRSRDIYPKLTDARYQGKLLGLPSDFSTIVMLYNRRLFEQYKIDPPKDGWTWSDYLETARRLTLDRPEGKIFGCANQPQYNRWPAWVWMAGGDIFDEKVTRCTMDSPESIEGFSFYANLSLKEKSRPDRPDGAGVLPVPLHRRPAR